TIVIRRWRSWHRWGRMLQRLFRCLLRRWMTNRLIMDRAITALAAIGPPAKDAVPGLMKVLKDGWVTSNAEKALAAIGPDAGPAAKDALPALREAMSDEAVRKSARPAIKKIELGDAE